MKKIITATLLASCGLACGTAQATLTPAASGEGNSNPASSATSFIYDVQETSAAPVYVTTKVAGNEASIGDVLAKTTFKVPQGVMSAKVTAGFVGSNDSSKLGYAFSADGNSGTAGQYVATGMTAGETANIVLLKAAELASGPTTVTYNVTTYAN
ncbi:hypothetical protein [Salmonella enterica]|uniref:Uncharacterized protein n=2 Tax=Salmonella enterica TaxID=28901 RepID=A0A7U7L390_SALER|nr:hypothetical protein [Salmonella enterica]EAA8665401.1 hypothetical protein [Salmonella enterica]PTU41890.1 hypothetical protein DAY03_12305 [Salmonella enterica subsp. enterica]